jgi:hypothetical protein
VKRLIDGSMPFTLNICSALVLLVWYGPTSIVKSVQSVSSYSFLWFDPPTDATEDVITKRLILFFKAALRHRFMPFTAGFTTIS